MDDDRDLRHFSGTCRLFPLPGVVMFPHAVLSLHIFEPRYRQMTEDALADDKLVTIVQLRPPGGSTAHTLGSPPIEAVGCLGRILRHERLPDGKFNFLLLGRKRVLLKREEPQADKLYRRAEAELIDDLEGDDPDDPRRDELVGLFRDISGRRRPLDPDLAAVLDNPLPLGVLTDIVAHAVGLTPEVKQLLLADPRVGQRADRLLALLRQSAPRDEPTRAGGGRPFPPPFSAN